MYCIFPLKMMLVSSQIIPFSQEQVEKLGVIDFSEPKPLFKAWI